MKRAGTTTRLYYVLAKSGIFTPHRGGISTPPIYSKAR